MSDVGYASAAVSVPSFGDSFFIQSLSGLSAVLFAVSVPSFGDSFFISSSPQPVYHFLSNCFRPLIRGFFFYYRIACFVDGISKGGFRPLIRGFFFYNSDYIALQGSMTGFRPLIRGFFFY